MSYRSHGTGSNWHFQKLHHVDQEERCELCVFDAEDSVVESSARLFYPNLIRVGSGSYIANEAILKGYINNASERLPSIVIGKGCWIGERAYLHGAGHITIGDYVGIGPNVQMLTSFHDAEGIEPLIHRSLQFKEIKILEGADIEAGSFICAGVTIGRGAIVRAGSVVTKNVGDFEIVAGNPAKHVRFRRNEEPHFTMKTL